MIRRTVPDGDRTELTSKTAPIETIGAVFDVYWQ